VRSLAPAEVADYLSGRKGFWPDGSPVRVVMRPISDGDNGYIAALAPAIGDALKLAHQRPGMVVATTDQEAADEAARLSGSLAFNTLALLQTEQRRLNVVAFDGVAPTVKALAEGRYPHFKPLLIITREATSSAAQRFIEFVKSPAGRALLEASGHFVPH
jgi:phosphate transport system substrate-binding protein